MELAFFEEGNAESNAICSEGTEIDPGLIPVIEAWKDLPDAVKSVILTLVKAAASRK